jgi:predicted phosphodiesterase
MRIAVISDMHGNNLALEAVPYRRIKNSPAKIAGLFSYLPSSPW